MEKPILVTRFNKDSEAWSGATYYNVRSGEPCSITTGESGTDNVDPGALLLHPYPGDRTLTDHRLHQLDKLYQSVAAALDKLAVAVGLTMAA